VDSEYLTIVKQTSRGSEYQGSRVQGSGIRRTNDGWRRGAAGGNVSRKTKKRLIKSGFLLDK